MPTRKELLESLLGEADRLGESLDGSAQASDELRSGLESLRSEISEAGPKLRKSILEGTLIGTVASGLVGGLIQNALQGRATDPRRIMARRIYDAVHLIADAQNAGDRHDYDSTLKLLRIHEFSADQSEYVVDLPLKTGAMKEYEFDGDDVRIMLDPESAAMRALQDGYRKNTLVYLTVGQPIAEDGDDEEDDDGEEDDGRNDDTGGTR